MTISIDDIIGHVPEDVRPEATEMLNGLKNVIPITPETFKVFGEDIRNKPIADVFFKEYASNGANSKEVNSLFDSRLSNSIKTYDENFTRDKLPKLLEEEIKKRYPGKTQAEIETAELKSKIENMELEGKRKDQLIIAKDLTKDLWDGFQPEFLVGDNNEETKENCRKFLDGITAWKDAAVKEKDNEWLERQGVPGSGEDGQPNKKYSQSSTTERTEYLRKHGEEKYRAWKKAG